MALTASRPFLYGPGRIRFAKERKTGLNHRRRAAVERLARTVEQLERLSGRPRSEVDAFALHEPNPRLARIFAQNARIPIEKIPLVSRTYGNLGSATCGVSLCVALDALAKRAPRPLIFLAAVGPGLLWAGTYLR